MYQLNNNFINKCYKLNQNHKINMEINIHYIFRLISNNFLHIKDICMRIHNLNNLGANFSKCHKCFLGLKDSFLYSWYIFLKINNLNKVVNIRNKFIRRLYSNYLYIKNKMECFHYLYRIFSSYLIKFHINDINYN